MIISNRDTIKERYRDYNLDLMDEFEVAPDSVGKCLGKPRSWDLYVEYSDKKHLRVFIITAKTVEKYGWDKIMEKNIFDTVYRFNIDSLNRRKWHIVYS